MIDDRECLVRLHSQLQSLRESVADTDDDPRLKDVHPSNRRSAANLMSYVALRRHDVRDLQQGLAALGLSSLGRVEAQVRPALDAVQRTVARLAGLELPIDAVPLADFSTGTLRLDEQATALLGKSHDGRRTRIMVTLPSEAATNPGIVEAVVRAGAELVRINCAHDDPSAWAAMVHNVRRAETIVGRDVKIAMDLAGPELRTGPIGMAPGVLRLQPERDSLGRTITPVDVWLTAVGGTSRVGATTVHVEDPGWLTHRVPGEQITFRDTRGSRRSMRIVSVDQDGILAQLSDTAYVNEGIALTASEHVVTVGFVPARERKIPLAVGDHLLLVSDLEPVDPASLPPRIGCTPSAIFGDARPGHRIYFDDGKIGGVVVSCSSDEIRVRITDTAPRGARLGAGKGLNLPDTTLSLPALTEADLAHLAVVVELADVVSLSFVRSGEDVAMLQHQLAVLDRPDLGLILKVETVAGFANLSEILLTALRSPHVGVMIARGDLAVDAGYARMADVQDEIRRFAEAAHVPVVWATQVLDGLTRTGQPSRAEVTDAAMSGRADCVMLNKGPFAVDAVCILRDILGRMSEHQRKKSPQLRPLRAWHADAPVREPSGTRDEHFTTSSPGVGSPRHLWRAR